MSDCRLVSTPLVAKHGLSLSQCPKTDEEKREYLEFANGIHVALTF
jgi:hypothetical protein